jgi:hypothetical protein
VGDFRTQSVIPAASGGIYIATRPRLPPLGKMNSFNDWIVAFSSIKSALPSSTSVPSDKWPRVPSLFSNPTLRTALAYWLLVTIESRVHGVGAWCDCVVLLFIVLLLDHPCPSVSRPHGIFSRLYFRGRDGPARLSN